MAILLRVMLISITSVLIRRALVPLPPRVGYVIRVEYSELISFKLCIFHVTFDFTFHTALHLHWHTFYSFRYECMCACVGVYVCLVQQR